MIQSLDYVNRATKFFMMNKLTVGSNLKTQIFLSACYKSLLLRVLILKSILSRTSLMSDSESLTNRHHLCEFSELFVKLWNLEPSKNASDTNLQLATARIETPLGC